MDRSLPLSECRDHELYAKGLECCIMTFSEYLTRLLYDEQGEIPRDVTHIPVHLVEDLKLRIDQVLREATMRMELLREGSVGFTDRVLDEESS